MQHPRREDRNVVTEAAAGVLPHLVEQVAHAVRRGFHDDLGAGLVRHDLADAGHVIDGVIPKRHFRTVKELGRCRAASVLAAGGRYRKAAVEAIKEQFLGAQRLGVRPHAIRTMLVIPDGHAKQVVGRFLQMRQNLRVDAEVERGPVIEPALNVGRGAALPIFQDQRTNATTFLDLALQLVVNRQLDAVERQRQQPT